MALRLGLLTQADTAPAPTARCRAGSGRRASRDLVKCQGPEMTRTTRTTPICPAGR